MSINSVVNPSRIPSDVSPGNSKPVPADQSGQSGLQPADNIVRGSSQPSQTYGPQTAQQLGNENAEKAAMASEAKSMDTTAGTTRLNSLETQLNNAKTPEELKDVKDRAHAFSETWMDEGSKQTADLERRTEKRNQEIKNGDQPTIEDGKLADDANHQVEVGQQVLKMVDRSGKIESQAAVKAEKQAIKDGTAVGTNSDADMQAAIDEQLKNPKYARQTEIDRMAQIQSGVADRAIKALP